jgi:hypothetical protein
MGIAPGLIIVQDFISVVYQHSMIVKVTDGAEAIVVAIMDFITVLTPRTTTVTGRVLGGLAVVVL